MEMTENIFVSIGSNLGNREGYLNDAIHFLELVDGVRVVRVSSIYETEPLYFAQQPRFLNMVAELSTTLSPHELLSVTQEIEMRLNRVRVIPKGPRTIDIDLIFYGEEIIDSDLLQVPHPNFRERKFVLEPLNEIEPDFICPGGDMSVNRLLKDCQDSSEVSFYSEHILEEAIV